MADSALPPGRFGAGYTVGGMTPAPPAAPAPPLARRLNRLAAATFGAALFFGLVVAPFTLPLSYLAQRQVQASGQDGAGLAKAAMLISALYLVIGAVVIVLYIYLRGANSTQ